MREIGQKLRIRPESSDIISEVVGIYPAGQQGRNYHEYVINHEGQKIRLKASVVEALFEEVECGFGPEYKVDERDSVDKNQLELQDPKPSGPERNENSIPSEPKEDKPQEDKPQKPTKKTKKGK